MRGRNSGVPSAPRGYGWLPLCFLKVRYPSSIREAATASTVFFRFRASFPAAMDMVEKIQKENWFDFDVVIASPDMMGVVGRLGKVLGPKGLMPSPKAGTVSPDVAKAVKEVKAGKIEYRLDKTNIIHCPIGKASFGPEKLTENYNAIMTRASGQPKVFEISVTWSSVGSSLFPVPSAAIRGICRRRAVSARSSLQETRSMASAR